MSNPQTIVGKIDRLLDDHCAVDEIAVLLNLGVPEVDRIARLLREVGPPDPDPLPAADVQATADQVAALDDPHDGWPRIGTSYAIDRGQALRQVQAATVVLRRATSESDLDDLAGALGIRHALGVAEQVMLPIGRPADDACRCTEIAPATLAQPAEWEQADDCPVHPRAVVDPVAPPCAGPEHDPGCDCCSCELDLISIDATAEPMAHIHDPFPVADEAGAWRAECECGTRWDQQQCDVCGVLVAALHIARSGAARCGSCAKAGA